MHTTVVSPGYRAVPFTELARGTIYIDKDGDYVTPWYENVIVLHCPNPKTGNYAPVYAVEKDTYEPTDFFFPAPEGTSITVTQGTIH